jgi:carboxylesterase type B
VTIFGESAGGTSVDAIITSPPNPVPFRTAIMQSTQASVKYPPWNGSANAWAELVKSAKCEGGDQLACMRAVPASDLLLIAEQKILTFEPEADGGVTFADNLRQNRLDSKDQPQEIAKVPIMIGTNADEGRFLDFKGIDLETGIRTLLGAGATIPEEYLKELLEVYAIGTPRINEPFDQITTLVTDVAAHCPAVVYINDSLSVGIDTWRYYYDASFPNSEIFPGSGANHAAEIDVVFGTYKENGATDWQRQVSRAMMKAWAAFARDPQTGPGWQQVPEVGSFGGGVRAGIEKDHGEAFEAISSESIDARCDLIIKLLAAVGAV